jgi:lysophospholipase L1-like esterase
MHYLALGDSYTIGESVPQEGRWPVQLTNRLRADGVILAEPQIIAQTGWTTDELAAAMTTNAAELQRPYHLVTLLIGVNNQYRGRSLDGYRSEFAALLQQAIALAGDQPQRVIVLSIPDWGVTPFAHRLDGAQIEAEIDAFNAVNAAETAVAGAHYIDITDISRQAAQAPALIADDGLHPSAAMYALWVDKVEPVACAILAEN